MNLSQDVLEGNEYCPGAFGGVASTSAFADNTFFVASQNYCSKFNAGQIPYKEKLINGFRIEPSLAGQSSTVHAIDVSTGQIKWTFPIESRYQGGITVSGGVVYLVDISGTFYALDSETGDVLKKIPMNGAGNTGVTIASDANGDMRLFVATGGSKSGIITALGLPEESTVDNDGISRRGIIGSLALTSIVGILYLVFLRFYRKN